MGGQPGKWATEVCTTGGGKTSATDEIVAWMIAIAPQLVAEGWGAKRGRWSDGVRPGLRIGAVRLL